MFILLASTVIDYHLVRYMAKAEGKRRKWSLIASLSLNLGLLAYFKYANFFVENFNQILSALGSENVAWTSVVLPIGISFYTFQTLSYAVDIYRREQEPLDRLSDYLMYIMMFPQLIAGPIVRYGEIAKQIRDRNTKTDDVLIGLHRFSIGLAKKVLVANNLGKFVDYCFANVPIDDMSSFQAWLTILCYTFQIYFDFSAYSDMAIGMGRMMGFKFPENFNFPYISRSITEFWRRWHMTLGSWMRDYLYIPLGGNRVARNRMYFNLALVFVLSGLWHGASWNFVLWGAFHGLFLVLDRLFLKKFLDKIGIFALPITFFITIIGWVFFRIENVSDALYFIKLLLKFDMSGAYTISKELGYSLLFAFIASVYTLIPKLKELELYWYQDKQLSLVQTLIFAVSSVFLIYLSTAHLVAGGFNPFIYFRF